MVNGRIFAAAVLLAIVTVGKALVMGHESGISRSFTRSEESFGNPLMGYAPGAGREEVDEDISLLYVDVTWRELEPEEGEYAWEQIEEENQFSRWRQEGKHMVFRFVCDIPRDEEHMDIPDWLYEKMGGQGSWYDMEYGRGFSPDYNSQVMVDAHKRAVNAMGERWGQDGFISFVELGSLGHWGEWHVNYSAGIKRLPMENVREQYVAPWIESFPQANILMRRPFSHAARYGLGVYNDMAGEPDSTGEWLGWIENGGSYSQTKEESAVVPMKECWKTAPVGGEFTSSVSMETMLETNLSQTVELIRKSHTTFLGPKIAKRDYEEGYRKVLDVMGYRLWLSRCRLQKRAEGTALTMTWENSGSAPFYENWPVRVYVEENGGILETADVEMKLPELMPGQQTESAVTLKTADVKKVKNGEQRILVGIIDPMTGRDAVRLAMDGRQEDGRVVLFE